MPNIFISITDSQNDKDDNQIISENVPLEISPRIERHLQTSHEVMKLKRQCSQ
jgi:hypothetical protein